MLCLNSDLHHKLIFCLNSPVLDYLLSKLQNVHIYRRSATLVTPVRLQPAGCAFQAAVTIAVSRNLSTFS